ncbi:MAG: S1 RNA-binding domain-containing protein, partial [Cyanobacteria bacterium P01_A01_bin.70]
LEGVVTNVANFGAFVDIGVHQDGLVHVSQLADRFVKDPKDIVKVGQVVTVRVLEVDEKLKRVSLSMRSPDSSSISSHSRPAKATKSQPSKTPKPQRTKSAKSQTQSRPQDVPTNPTLQDLQAKFNSRSRRR